ncbi:MAG: FAD-dependent oxidoreductase [Thermoleophilia bacterium]
MVVVGAGVSGCVSALALAAEGVRVVLVNSALDSVGLPGYGPVVDYGERGGDQGHRDLDSPGAGLAEVLRKAAAPLASAWLAHAWAPVGGLPLALVDRRAVSLAVKWRVENEDLIELRQGIVVAVEGRDRTDEEAESSAAVSVRTAFGERIVGDAVVVAVGLALGGRVSVGDQKLAGGRLGEVAADALLEDLRLKGAVFEEARVSVGMRLSARGGLDVAHGGGTPPVGFTDHGAPSLRSLEFVPVTVGLEDLERWAPEVREGFVAPPSPYDHSRSPVAVLAWDRGASDSLREEDLVLVPDGTATGEWYVPPGASRDLSFERVLGPGAGVSRPAHEITGFVASCGEGQLLPEVWVVGQAAGARNYLESIAGGWRIGHRVAACLGVGSR